MLSFHQFLQEGVEDTLIRLLALANRPGTPEEGDVAKNMAIKIAAKHGLNLKDFEGRQSSSAPNQGYSSSGMNRTSARDEYWDEIWQQVKRKEIEQIAGAVGFVPYESDEYGFDHTLRNGDFYIFINIKNQTWSIYYSSDGSARFVVANGKLSDLRKLKTVLKDGKYKDKVQDPKIQTAIDLAQKAGFTVDPKANTLRFVILHRGNTSLIILKENGMWAHLNARIDSYEEASRHMGNRLGGSKKLSELRAYLKNLA